MKHAKKRSIKRLSLSQVSQKNRLKIAGGTHGSWNPNAMPGNFDADEEDNETATERSGRKMKIGVGN